MSLLRRFWRRVRDRTRRNFLTGLLLIVPLGLTYYVVAAIVRWTDRFLAFLPPEFHPETYLGFRIPGLGIVVTLVLIQIVGFLSANLMGRSVVKAYEHVLERIPFVRTLYLAVKQMMEQLIAGDSDRFRRVVLVEYPRKGLYSLAFVTGVGQGEVQKRTGERVLNVFVPTTPNPTSGYYLLVPEEDAIPLDIGVEQAFKMIMSAGIVGSGESNGKARPPWGGRASEPGGTDPGSR